MREVLRERERDIQKESPESYILNWAWLKNNKHSSNAFGQTN
jgi:hypothetical protein